MILENRIGFGKYQIKAFFSLALVDLIDGLDIISMSLILPMVEDHWKLSPYELTITSSIFFLGMLIGAFFSG